MYLHIIIRIIATVNNRQIDISVYTHNMVFIIHARDMRANSRLTQQLAHFATLQFGAVRCRPRPRDRTPPMTARLKTCI